MYRGPVKSTFSVQAAVGKIGLNKGIDIVGSENTITAVICKKPQKDLLIYSKRFDKSLQKGLVSAH